MQKEYTCTVCPMGCTLIVTYEGDEIIDVTGYECNKGTDYATKEHTSPERMLTTTVRVEGGELPLVPVRTTDPIPKGVMLYCMEALAKVEVAAPVKEGDTIVSDILGTGVNIIATRSVGKPG
ncbi:MAG: DUF1667 domain-containing protein [Planctomycetes bacterium]|nr:DUF1667 domain-containing protein [Planctomycetota bacterium]